MEKASGVFYSIANFFNWIVLLIMLFLSIIGGLVLGGVINWAWAQGLGNWGVVIGCGLVALFCLITIWMVRRAKAAGSSKAWDVLFIIIGILDCNIFYILGGIFGVLARRP